MFKPDIESWNLLDLDFWSLFGSWILDLGSWFFPIGVVFFLK